MQVPDIPCPACRAPLPADAAALASMDSCPACRKPLEVIPFPGLASPPVAGAAAEVAVSPDDATCFFHASKKAVIPCDGCGRFLCALCDLHIHGVHLCPQCLEAGRRKRTVASLERSRTRWDLITISLAAFSLLCGFPAPIAFIANVAIAVIAWRKPQSRVAASRVTMVVATIVSGLCALAFAWFVMAQLAVSKPE
jgi:hypothetical protein